MKPLTICSFSIHLCIAAFIFLVMSLFSVFELVAESNGTSSTLSPSEFVSRVLSHSKRVQLIELEAQMAYHKKELSIQHLTIPSLNFKVYPFGYDSARVNTFISQYAFDPSKNASESNPMIFAGLRPYNDIYKKYYVFGEGLEFKSYTPLGGTFSFNLNHFFLLNVTKEDYRQRIKFDAILSQPLVFNRDFINFQPFFNQFIIYEDEYSMALVDKINKRNQIIKGAYKHAYALITLTKQKELLEKTVGVLSKDLDAMNVRLKDKQVSKVAVQSLELALSQQHQKLREVTSSYHDLRRNAQEMIALDSVYIAMKQDTFLTDTFVQKQLISKNFESNHKVKKRYLEYQIASKNIFSRDIQSRPRVDFKLSLEPQYSEPRKDVKDFWKSFTDLTAKDSTVDVTFTIALTIPLLTKFEREHRSMLDALSVEVHRKSYERELANVRRSIENQEDRYSDLRKKRDEIELELLLQRVFLDEKNIQLRQGTTSLQEKLRQELKFIEVSNKQWDVQQQMLLLALDIIDAKGVDIATLLP